MDYSSPQVIGAVTAILAAVAAYLRSVNTAGKNAKKIAVLEGIVERCESKITTLESTEQVNPKDYRQFQQTMGDEIRDQSKTLNNIAGMVRGLD